MSKKILILPVLMLVFAAGCGGDDEFAAEKSAIETATKAMETFASAVGSSDSPEVVTQALGAFSTSFESVLPALKKIKTDHADWETTPPEPLKDTYAQFKSASSGFMDVMPNVMKAVSEHPDDAGLLGAVQKFQSLVSSL